MNHLFAGVDTHSKFHVIALVDDDGRHIDHQRFDTDRAGLDAAVGYLVARQAVRVGIEGSSSYGAGLNQLLQPTGIEVLEVTGPDRAGRRRDGKSDTIDAYQAAHAVRTELRVRPAKDPTRLAEFRAYYMLYQSAMTARTQVGNQIHAIAPQLEPGTQPGALTVTKVRALATKTGPLATAANRWLMLHTEILEHHKHLTSWLRRYYPDLLDQPYVGPISAAQLVLTAGDNPNRMTTEAAFAHLAGTAPIPASSGKHQRMRLNPGGDRRANQALWRIAFLRAHRDPRTIEYLRKRQEEDHKTYKETLRCLQRYIARELFPYLTPKLDNQ